MLDWFETLICERSLWHEAAAAMLAPERIGENGEDVAVRRVLQPRRRRRSSRRPPPFPGPRGNREVLFDLKSIGDGVI